MNAPTRQTGTGESPTVPLKAAAEMLSSLISNQQVGLTSAEARTRLEREGPNEVPERPVHRWLDFAKKFWSLSAWMIELIAVLSFILQKYTDLAVALALLVVNAVLSSLQEQRASSAVVALRHQLQVTTRGTCGTGPFAACRG